MTASDILAGVVVGLVVGVFVQWCSHRCPTLKDYDPEEIAIRYRELQ